MTTPTALENLDEYDLPTPETARDMLWEMGDLTFRLDENQIQLRDSYLNSKSKNVVWACSRRIGKSYTLCVIAIEKCLSKRNATVCYLASTQKDVRNIIRPLMRQLTADAPESIRPIEKKAEGIWFFPSTGSQIKIMGCDGGRADSARGSDSDLCLIDEAGFVDDLEYIIKSILNPTTLLTKGKIILASTPPKTPTHEFVVFMNQAKIDGSFVRKTIYDNPRLTQDDIRQVAEDDCGGIDTISFRREYLAEVIPDDDMMIVPEFKKELQPEIVRAYVRPPFYDNYVAMDVGSKDLTVVLFAYYDFKAAKLIIEDEYVVTGKEFTTDVLAKNIRLKEAEHFTDKFTGELIKPRKRVSDNELLLINDLYRTHKLLFLATKKDDAESALNNLRVSIANKSIIINPRCKVLISHLEAGVWNKQKTSFARSGLKYGHFDAIDTLKYLVRNVDFTHNPYPQGYNFPNKNDAFYYKGGPNRPSKEDDMVYKMMNIKTKR